MPEEPDAALDLIAQVAKDVMCTAVSRLSR